MVGGTYCYIPKPDYLIRQARNSSIRREYNGYNVKDLANKYHMSTVSIYRILKVAAPVDGQISLFEGEDN